ncbi:NAD(P)H-hydrate epimerase [Halorubellus sp. PRR65]|uniref:NAD(P)H-hydrate epimerase n=1 Tax=Halorubellus sp. PRR65 TaxID=3098148 RepID=UPI002B25C4BD|nr:NAD(P)H-hydrate epimerase [Halorubellus sp. PRR65]
MTAEESGTVDGSEGSVDASRPAFETSHGVRVPSVTAAEMRAVDRVAVDGVGLPVASMMENAGRNLAKASRAVVGGLPQDAVVVAGGGGNGGGGLAAARHLSNHGTDVTVVLDRDRDALEGAPAGQAAALDGTDATVVHGEGAVHDAVDAVLDVDVAIDALVGYGLTDDLAGTAGDLAQVVDQGAKRSLSLDVPSGFDATTGDAPGRAVHPDATLTLALPKTGLDAVSGDLLLGDIGIPAGVYERAGVRPPDAGTFGGQYVVALAQSKR